VSTVLVSAITVVAVLLAVLGGAAVVAQRRIGLVHVAGAVLLEVLLLVQAVIAVVAMAGGKLPVETATFVGYLVGVVLVPVAGILWARTEPTRWAGGVIVVAGLVVAVMAWRLLQLWEVIRA
jgi:hypothetical protein